MNSDEGWGLEWNGGTDMLDSVLYSKVSNTGKCGKISTGTYVCYRKRWSININIGK